MKKVLTAVLALIMVITCFALVSCDDGGKTENGKYEIAVVTDVGQLMDGSFNQGCWEGAVAYAQANNKTYKYYQPANGSDATNADREAAMRLAITNGAKIIVAPGFLQADAMIAVAKENPEVKFIFIDGWVLTDENNQPLTNITAVAYKEEESGYMAGYAAVMEGYTKLGATLGGGGSNPACNRYGFGYVQGAAAAAAEKNIDVTVKVSFQFGESFSASDKLLNQISGWYVQGTEVVFACGGSMFNSVKSAAEGTENGKIIGVDVDQTPSSERVITSAAKGLKESVTLILGKFYNNEWDTNLSAKLTNLGAVDNATGLPTANWKLQNFTKEAYEALFNKIKDGTVVIKTEGTSNDINNADFWSNAFADTRATVEFE